MKTSFQRLKGKLRRRVINSQLALETIYDTHQHEGGEEKQEGSGASSEQCARTSLTMDGDGGDGVDVAGASDDDDVDNTAGEDDDLDGKEEENPKAKGATKNVKVEESDDNDDEEEDEDEGHDSASEEGDANLKADDSDDDDDDVDTAEEEDATATNGTSVKATSSMWDMMQKNRKLIEDLAALQTVQTQLRATKAAKQATAAAASAAAAAHIDEDRDRLGHNQPHNDLQAHLAKPPPRRDADADDADAALGLCDLPEEVLTLVAAHLDSRGRARVVHSHSPGVSDWLHGPRF